MAKNQAPAKAKPANIPAAPAKKVTPAAPEAAPAKPAKEKREKRSHKALMAARLGRALKRVAQARSFLRDSEAAEAATEAETALKQLTQAVQDLDDNWTRARSRKGAQVFGEGQLVAVNNSWKATYEELMDEEEMDELRVVKKAETKNGNAVYSVVTADGTRLFIPAAHLRAAE